MQQIAEGKTRSGTVTRLGVRFRAGETPRQTVERVGRWAGVAWECLHTYDAYVALGADPYDAAFCALNDWDCVGILEEE
jgi:hypothetical protein